MPVVNRTCPQCGQNFSRYVTPSGLAKGHGVYCSTSCSSKQKPHKTDRVEVACQCCGEIFETLPCHLKKGAGKFCSLACKHEAQRGAPLKHGNTWAGGVTPTYRAWNNMKSRCLTPTHPSYHRYGGRGISIHPKWLDFDAFLADMGTVPEGMTLERIDNDGNYEPGNVEWASRRTQYRNRSTNVWVMYKGTQMIAQDAADLAGVSLKAFRKRMRSWPEEHWFDPPTQGRGRVRLSAA